MLTYNLKLENQKCWKHVSVLPLPHEQANESSSSLSLPLWDMSIYIYIYIPQNRILKAKERETEMGYTKVLLGVVLASALAITSTAQPLAPFKCSKATVKCIALIDYVSPRKTTLSAIQDLFQVKKLRNLLGANNFPSTTSEKQTVHAQQKIRIPFTCSCSNGTGLSNPSLVYTAFGGGGLYHIAAEGVFWTGNVKSSR
jgi:hypothetical protein